MIKAADAIAAARSLIGTPYAELDCINLIKKVIRTAPGGVSGYTTAGTNTLWNSYNASGKYRDLTWRGEISSPDGKSGGAEPRPYMGMLAFKRRGEDVHHVGLVTGDGTVIHSSSVKGEVVETALDGTWQLLAVHRYITPSVSPAASHLPQEGGLEAEESEGAGMESYRAKVVLNDMSSTLNVRNEPGAGGDIIGRLHHGAQVTVQAAFDNGWLYVSYGDSGLGYVSGKYLQRVEDEPTVTENVIAGSADVTIIDDAGNTFKPVGGWRVLVGSVD